MVIGWNEHSEECFGWTWEEARGQRLSDLIIPPAFRDAHEDGSGALSRNRRRPGARPPDRGQPRSTATAHEFPVELSITASEQFGEQIVHRLHARHFSDRKAGGRAPAAHPPGKRASGEEHADRGAGDRAPDRGQFARHGKLHDELFGSPRNACPRAPIAGRPGVAGRRHLGAGRTRARRRSRRRAARASAGRSFCSRRARCSACR